MTCHLFLATLLVLRPSFLSQGYAAASRQLASEYLSRLRNPLTYHAKARNTHIGQHYLKCERVHVSYSASPLLKALLGHFQCFNSAPHCFFFLRGRHHPVQQVKQHKFSRQQYTDGNPNATDGPHRWPPSSLDFSRSLLVLTFDDDEPPHTLPQTRSCF